MPPEIMRWEKEEDEEDEEEAVMGEGERGGCPSRSRWISRPREREKRFLCPAVTFLRCTVSNQVVIFFRHFLLFRRVFFVSISLLHFWLGF